MKFVASSSELLQALNTVSGAVPSKSTLPILETVLFEREGDQLRLSATDLEISIQRTLPVQFESNGTPEANRVAVPARRLLDTLKALPELPVQFSSDEEFHVVLRTDQGEYRMVGFDPAEYPEIPEVSTEHMLAFPGDMLKRAVQKTAFAVSKDALRPAMMGIFFQVKPEETRVVATDGHRLVRLALKGLAYPDSLEFIVPEKALALAGKVVDGETQVAVDDRFVSFTSGPARVTSRLIDETYPNYEAVIPLDNDRRLTVNRLSMLAAVRRVSLYSSSMTHQVRLSLHPTYVEISAEDIEGASAAREKVLAEYEGEPMDIGFNAIYLTEILSHLDAEDVIFEFSSPNRAGVVRPATQQEQEDMLMLIMPVMLNTYA